MKRGLVTFCAVTIFVSAVAVYGFISWDRSNGTMPAEILPLLDGSTRDTDLDISTGSLNGRVGWYRQHRFSLPGEGQPIAKRAKELFTKESGWTLEFPNPGLNPYSFQARKQDAGGKVVASVTFECYDYLTREGDHVHRLPNRLCFVDASHPFPWWRGVLADYKKTRRARQDSVVY